MPAEFPDAQPSFAGMVGTAGVSPQNAPSQTALFQKLADEVTAIAAELGLNPSAGFATVLARLAALDTTAAAKIAASTLDANSVLVADTDDTPVARMMGASTILARLAAGAIVAATPTQLRTLINVQDGATDDLTAAEILALLLGVDGAGSGLDADLLDGSSIAAFVLKSLFDAHTILAATSDDTPAALTVGEQTLIGRITGGNITALTPAEIRTLLALVIGTNVQAWDADLDTLAAGGAGATSLLASLLNATYLSVVGTAADPISDPNTARPTAALVAWVVESGVTPANALATDIVVEEGDVLAIADVNGLQSALDLKAALASPTFTGTPAAPTAAPGTNTTQLANTAFVAAALTALIGTAPGVLDTLGEISDAINDDANLYTTLVTLLNAKAPAANPVFTGTVTIPDAALAIADTSGLQAALDGKPEKDSFDGFGIPRTWITQTATSATITIFGVNDAWWQRIVDGGTISKILIFVTTSSGNVSLAANSVSGTGRAAVPGAQLAGSGSIACPAGGNAEVSLGASVPVHSGDFFGIAADNTTATFVGGNGAGAFSALEGLSWWNDAAFPLPNPPVSLTARNTRFFAMVGVA